MILDARPVTQQGLRGSRAPTSSGARMVMKFDNTYIKLICPTNLKCILSFTLVFSKVQDGGYFIGVLRQKIKDIDQVCCYQLLNIAYLFHFVWPTYLP